MTHCTSKEHQRTYLCQHCLSILEIAKHSLDISFIGRPGQEAPSEPLHSLHCAGEQQLLAMLGQRGEVYKIQKVEIQTIAKQSELMTDPVVAVSANNSR